MLPTHDIPAVRCEAAAPGVEVGVSYTDDLLEKILAELVTIRTILLTTPR